MTMTVGGEHERTFELFGSSVRLLVGPSPGDGMPGPRAAAIQAEAILRRIHAELTRFDPASPLSGLNSDPAAVRRVPPLLATAIEASVAAAMRSGGLVDPTLLPALEAAGYAGSRVGAESAPLGVALREAPPRAPARPDPAARWKPISVDRLAGTVTRPPGTRIDLGGTAKGLAADLISARLAGHASYVVDAGGDIRIGGAEARARRVDVDDPFGDGTAHSFELAAGAVATSGIGTRLWRAADAYAHHLIDPGSGLPAWTGIVQATAVADTAVEAEMLAKAALLSGPEGAGAWLADRGGVVILDDGGVVVHGSPAGARAGEPLLADAA
jgi:thiamine biosynthesis lipoprotein